VKEVTFTLIESEGAFGGSGKVDTENVLGTPAPNELTAYKRKLFIIKILQSSNIAIDY